jgi:hypothetical protein
MKRFRFFILFIALSACLQGNALILRPGFDKAEYRDMLMISARFAIKPEFYKDLPEPGTFRKLYQSQVMGLDNQWNLWLNDRNIAVISIRGTTGTASSWLANFYSGMVPAKGFLLLSKTDTFRYQLAENPRAAIHIGWLLSTAYLSRDFLPKIDSLYKSGTRDFLISGHSQGGAISYLVTALLYQMQKTGKLPSDIRFKTYCSAGPKPGNLYFAYEYELLTLAGWSYNVVNAVDWVPESPFSIQTTKDFSEINPFSDSDKLFGKLKFPKNLIVKSFYNRLDRSTRKAKDTFGSILGRKMSKFVNKFLPEFIPPEEYICNDYVRTGNTIVLYPGKDYFEKYPEKSDNLFVHHFQRPYLFLLENSAL